MRPGRHRWDSLLAGLILTGSAGISVAGHATRDHSTLQNPQYANPAYATLAPSEVDFGKQVVGWTHQAKRVIVTNTGGKPLMIDSVAPGGDHSGEFEIVKDTCTGAEVP